MNLRRGRKPPPPALALTWWPVDGMVMLAVEITLLNGLPGRSWAMVAMKAQRVFATIQRAVATLSSMGGLGPTAARAAGAASTARARKGGRTQGAVKQGAGAAVPLQAPRRGRGPARRGMEAP